MRRKGERSTTSKPASSQQTVLSRYVWVWVGVSVGVSVSTTSRPALSRQTVLSRYVGVGVGVGVHHIKAIIITADRVVTV